MLAPSLFSFVFFLLFILLPIFFSPSVPPFCGSFHRFCRFSRVPRRVGVGGGEDAEFKLFSLSFSGLLPRIRVSFWWDIFYCRYLSLLLKIYEAVPTIWYVITVGSLFFRAVAAVADIESYRIRNVTAVTILLSASRYDNGWNPVWSIFHKFFLRK